MTAAHRNALILVLFFSIALSAQPQVSSESTITDWPTASNDQVGLSEARLRSLDAAIRSGEFNKIGSVLIARHGKLVYESYFDGDAATLRDTRSATKSITDILIGIAIDEHKLSGVDAKILAQLPERARRMQNSDPRKTTITIEVRRWSAMTGMTLLAATRSGCIWWRIGRNSSSICRSGGACG
jgi:CubicO group peptidase (beta-lactamase class C family)